MTELLAKHDRCRITAKHGVYYWGNSLDLMRTIPDASVDLLLFSPPFGGPAEIPERHHTGDSFVRWFRPFCAEFARILRPTGSLVFELGATWLTDAPGKAVQHAAAIHTLAGSGWRLIQDFYCYTPQPVRLTPACPARAADLVLPIWVMSRTYDVYYDAAALRRPPYVDHLRGNLLEFGAADEADRAYERALAATGLEPNRQRWPVSLPMMFVELLSRAGDLVLDPFAGTGAASLAAERLGRRWIGIERDRALEPHVRAMFASVGNGVR
ncbi:DNA-methyltransferase [Streptoalloteichus hindustanus]|uniref:Methyltransferase n=1 Tax=Streptoalloteichus hindustanus TaxID=2017 RepID=A0A1M5CXU7_STRHI|nr:DNA methyltransferase [Streptoalloteichus hindustanus]SHF59342.1 site-specific DNA-methyltransferase (cytosine-N4-specific) [Streptoalloteichus hindustanus]